MALEQISLFDFLEEQPPKEAKETATPPADSLPGKAADNPVENMEENIPEVNEPEENFSTPPVEEPETAAEAIDLTSTDSIVARKHSTPKPKSKRGRMKLSDMDKTTAFVNVPEDEVLFTKRYYPIGEVAGMFGVNIGLIRFWEKEFIILKPKKNGKGDRLFRPEDVKNLKIIHHLLRERKYTIEGAKEFLKAEKKASENFERIEQLRQIKNFLLELKATL